MNLTSCFDGFRRYTAQVQKEEPFVSWDSGVENLKKLERDVLGFQKLSEYLRRETGINLNVSEKNQTLLASRVMKILPLLGLPDYSSLHAALVGGRRDARDLFINTITTNTTHFFREGQHFDVLARMSRDLLSDPEKKRAREIRAWCAACSTGEEAYTISMVLNSIFPARDGWNLKILATDIDTDVLRTAVRGVYPQEVLDTVPEQYRASFEAGTGNSKGYVRVRKAIRDSITFAPFNLMTPSYPFQSKFDFIFCRNVMIYFDRPEIHSTIRKIEGCLRHGGLLFIGHSETVVGVTPGLKSRAPAVYERLKVGRKGEAA